MDFAPEQPGLPCRDSEHPKCPHPRAPRSIALQHCVMPQTAAHGCWRHVLDFGVSAAFGDCRAGRSAFHAAGCRSLSLWPITLLGRSGAGQGAPVLVLLIPSPVCMCAEHGAAPAHHPELEPLSWHCVLSDASSSPHPPHPPLLRCDLGHAFPILCSLHR